MAEVTTFRRPPDMDPSEARRLYPLPAGCYERLEESEARVREMRERIWQRNKARIRKCGHCGAKIVFVTDFNRGKPKQIPVTWGDAQHWHTLWEPRRGHKRHQCGKPAERRPVK